MTVIRPLLVTADHPVTRHPDQSFDQVLGPGVGQHADELQGLAERPALGGAGADQPAARILEDHDLAALDRASASRPRPGRSTLRVFSIDTDGIRNIWPTKARNSEETMIAPMTTAGQFLDEGPGVLAKAQLGGPALLVTSGWRSGSAIGVHVPAQ